jgi:hypothetical protein
VKKARNLPIQIFLLVKGLSENGLTHGWRFFSISAAKPVLTLRDARPYKPPIDAAADAVSRRTSSLLRHLQQVNQNMKRRVALPAARVDLSISIEMVDKRIWWP